MKKILSTIIVLVLIISITGCQNDKPITEENVENAPQEITNNLEDNIKTDNPTEDSELDPNSPESSSDDSTLLETQFVVAEYVGQIDNNSIEVKIEDGTQAFRLNGIAKEQLATLGLDKGDLVELEVFTNENNQLTVYSMNIPK